MHLFPNLCSVTATVAAINYFPGRNIYTTENGKCYKSWLFPHRAPLLTFTSSPFLEKLVSSDRAGGGVKAPRRPQAGQV